MADIYDLADEWDNGATTFTAIKMDVTDTASAADSKLIDLQVGSVSMFSVDKAGNVTSAGNFSFTGIDDNSTETAMTIDTSERINVGANTTITGSGGMRFQLSGTSQATAGFAQGYFADNGFPTVNRYYKSRGITHNAHGIVNDGDEITEFSFFASDGTGYIEAARIEIEIDGTPGTNDMPGRMVFSTTNDGFSAPTEKMRLTQDGRLGIGVTTVDDNLHVLDTIRIQTSDDNSGLFWEEGSGGSGIAAVYNGTENQLRFVAGTGGDPAGFSTDIMALDRDNGFVGIGGNPGYKLHAQVTSGDCVVAAQCGTGSVNAIYSWITGTVNSSVSAALFDNSGTPYLHWQTGSAVESVFYDFDNHQFRSTAGTEFARITTNGLGLFNGTAPTASVTNGVILYSEDVAASAELKVRDEAGNITTLSPHNFSLIPEGPSEPMAWGYYSERDGNKVNIDMMKAMRLLEKLSGEKLIYEQKKRGRKKK